MSLFRYTPHIHFFWQNGWRKKNYLIFLFYFVKKLNGQQTFIELVVADRVCRPPPMSKGRFFFSSNRTIKKFIGIFSFVSSLTNFVSSEESVINCNSVYRVLFFKIFELSFKITKFCCSFGVYLLPRHEIRKFLIPQLYHDSDYW